MLHDLGSQSQSGHPPYRLSVPRERKKVKGDDKILQVLRRIVGFVKSVLVAFTPKRKAWSMAVVRRYADANGSYVGELYLLGTFAGVLQYSMIGVSLDTLPFDARAVEVFDLDTDNDFLAPMPPMCVRVGALNPQDNDNVRKYVAKMAHEGRIVLQVQNRFVEHVLNKVDRK